MKKNEQRFLIKWYVLKGFGVKIIHQKLKDAFGDNALAHSTIEKWAKRFKEGDLSCDDKKRSGRPPLDINDSLGDNLKEDPFLSSYILAGQLECCRSTVSSHIHNDLGLKRYKRRLIAYDLNESQKIERVNKSKELLKILRQHQQTDFKYIITLDESWFYLRNEQEYMYADSPEKVIPIVNNTISTKKLNVTIAFCGNRLFLLKGFSRGIATNQAIFKEEILVPIVKRIHNRTGGPSIEAYHIHFDNAPAHTASKTTKYLMRTKLKNAIHPAYSPDLSPCDFWFFGYCKNKLKGMKINDEADLLQKVLNTFSEVTFEELQSVFVDWIDRLETVIKTGGDVINESLF